MIVAVLVPEFVVLKAASDNEKVSENKIKFEGVLQTRRSVKFWIANQAYYMMKAGNSPIRISCAWAVSSTHENPMTRGVLGCAQKRTFMK